MSDRMRTVLIASLAFNLVLLIVALVFFFQGNRDGGTAADGGDDVIVRVTATLAATATPVPTLEPMATEESAPAATATSAEADEPAATPTPLPTVTPAPTDTPMPTATPAPTDTRMPTATATAVAMPMPDWLSYINEFRRIGNLPLLRQSFDLTAGSEWHSSYMVINDEPFAHSEDPNNPLFKVIGDEAARKGNIFATSQADARFNWAVNFWFSAPFHSVPLLDPKLHTVGYGDYVEEVGDFTMSAVAEVRTGLGELPESVTYPLFFPGDGSQTWITRLSLLEWPSPYGNCPGYQQPTGPALIMQLGPGDVTPNVEDFAVTRGGKVVAACLFDETNYSNANIYTQELGRTILGTRDAIVIIPREQLAVGETYGVTVAVNGATHSWTFDVIKPPK